MGFNFEKCSNLTLTFDLMTPPPFKRNHLSVNYRHDVSSPEAKTYLNNSMETTDIPPTISLKLVYSILNQFCTFQSLINVLITCMSCITPAWNTPTGSPSLLLWWPPVNKNHYIPNHNYLHRISFHI